MTKIINLLGPPCAGKSTVAFGLANLMKKDFLKVELVTEYAKDLIYSEQEKRLIDQDLIFAEQRHRVHRLVGKVDYVVTDSPLFLSAFYAPDSFPQSFRDFAMAMANRYDNVNIYLNRNHPYDPSGRVHSEEQSVELDPQLRMFLQCHCIPYQEISTGPDIEARVYAMLRENVIKLRPMRGSFGP